MEDEAVVDVVLIRWFGGWKEMTPVEFFKLPLSERIRHVVQRTVEFKKAGATVDPHAALAALRRLQAA